LREDLKRAVAAALQTLGRRSVGIYTALAARRRSAEVGRQGPPLLTHGAAFLLDLAQQRGMREGNVLRCMNPRIRLILMYLGDRKRVTLGRRQKCSDAAKVDAGHCGRSGLRPQQAAERREAGATTASRPTRRHPGWLQQTKSASRLLGEGSWPPAPRPRSWALACNLG
jgi:hypothetical protein